MIEFTTRTHYVTIDDEAMAYVTRKGRGVPKTIMSNVDVLGPFSEVIGKLNNIMGLDDEMFNMISDSQTKCPEVEEM